MKREIRAGAIAGASGVGAVIDVGTESFVIPGIDQWRQPSLRIVSLPRLSSRLKKILKAPVEEKPTLMVRRFPRAMFCEKCRKITNWKTEMERDGEKPTCSHLNCGGDLVPMRFVVACKNGHLDDFDWGRWAHSGKNAVPGCRSRDDLRFEVDTGASTGGLGSLIVRCRICQSSRSLEDIANKDAVRPVLAKCTSRHPWIFAAHGECNEDPEVLQRGATNLHYPATISALDIPEGVVVSPAAEFAGQAQGHGKYSKLKQLMSDTQGSNQDFLELLAETIAKDIGCGTSVVMEIVKADIDGRALGEAEKRPQEFDQNVLLEEEWKTISVAISSGGMKDQHFRSVSESLQAEAPAWIHNLIDGILLVDRLREVRAYLGFQRISPGEPDKKVPPDVGASQSWLPCVEVFGEGIVLSFDYTRLRQWADSIPEKELRELEQLENKRVEENFWFLPQVEPVFIALHALSHLLMRRITFECGYSSSSLRERLYVNHAQEYAGVMIYTADGDSEGSLGGLVRQGRSDRFAQTLYEAIDQGSWCSADPVCSETAGQGLGGFNRASCHACLLVSETSCTHANTLLDRRLLLDPEWGLLAFLGRSA